jgi:hypothetical protein
MMQGRKNSSYESSTRIAFLAILSAIVLVVFMLLFPKIASPQNTEWRKPDVTSMGDLIPELTIYQFIDELK